MGHAMMHLRFALRLIAKTPGQSMLAIISLGLGIGLTGTAFSVVYGTTIKGLPFVRSDQLMVIERSAQKGAAGPTGSVATRVHQLSDWNERQRSFQSIGAFVTLGVNLASAGSLPERVPGALLSPNTLAVLDVRPVLGRGFSPDDGRPGAPRVALIGHAVWRNRFAGDPGVVGRAVQMNGQITTIVGVMPERFGFPLSQSLWLPMNIDPLQTPRGQGQRVTVFGRLADGASIEEARAEFAALTSGLAAQHPQEYAATAVTIRPYWRRFLGDEGAVLSMYAMLAAVFGVLLIACANVANLLLARAVVRTRELAVRVALGASRSQIVGHVFAESATLALAGGAVGLAIAWAGVSAFRRVAVSTNPPFWMEFTLSPPVIAAVLALVVVAALTAGLAPAWRASRQDLSQVLNDASRGTSSLRLGRFTRVLVVGQLALSMAVLIPSASMIKAIVDLETRDYGFAIADVVTGYVSLPASAYPDDQRWVSFYRELDRRLSAAPGSRGVALASSLPGQHGPTAAFEVEGQTVGANVERPSTQAITVSPGYFATYGVAASEGRVFSAGDQATTRPVAIVNTRFASRFLTDGPAVGRRIRFIEEGGKTSPWREIVGVVPDMFLGGTDLNRDWGVYVPFEQGPVRSLNVVVRGAGTTDTLVRQLREAVAAVDESLPVGSVQTMQQVIFQATWQTRLFGSLFASFGIASLLLSVVGVYGVVAFATGQRLREFNIRIALGSTTAGLIALTLKQGLAQLLVGSLFGLGGGFGLSMIFTQVEPGMRVVDPFPLSLVLGAFVAATLAAHLIPAAHSVRGATAQALKD